MTVRSAWAALSLVAVLSGAGRDDADLAEAFVAFVRSADGRDVLTRLGFLPPA